MSCVVIVPTRAIKVAQHIVLLLPSSKLLRYPEITPKAQDHTSGPVAPIAWRESSRALEETSAPEERSLTFSAFVLFGGRSRGEARGKMPIVSHQLLAPQIAPTTRSLSSCTWPCIRLSGKARGKEAGRRKEFPGLGEGKQRGIAAVAAWTATRETSFLSPLVQASAPRTVRGLTTPATLGKPLVREFLFYRCFQSLSTPSGSGLYVAREPRLPRIHATAET